MPNKNNIDTSGNKSGDLAEISDFISKWFKELVKEMPDNLDELQELKEKGAEGWLPTFADELPPTFILNLRECDGYYMDEGVDVERLSGFKVFAKKCEKLNIDFTWSLNWLYHMNVFLKTEDPYVPRTKQFQKKLLKLGEAFVAAVDTHIENNPQLLKQFKDLEKVFSKEPSEINEIDILDLVVKFSKQIMPEAELAGCIPVEMKTGQIAAGFRKKGAGDIAGLIEHALKPA